MPKPNAIDTCLHCNLAVAVGDPYCCYGCELAAGIEREAAADQSRTYNTFLFALLLTMFVMMLSLFLYAEDIYTLEPNAGFAWLRTAYRIAIAVLTTPVVLLCGVPLGRRALRRLRRGILSMELLIVSAAVAAYGTSMWAVFHHRSQVFFESAATALVLATLGRYLEAKARQRACGLLAPTLKLVGRPVKVIWPKEHRGEMAPAQMALGWHFHVPLEGVVPVDAQVLGTEVEVDLSVITGESMPVLLTRGDSVPAGAVVLSDGFEGEVTRLARDSTLDQLGDLSRMLREHPPLLVRLSDRFANYLVPLIYLIAIAAGIVWSMTTTLSQGIVVALAVVLAACPCIYGVAIPLVLWMGLRTALSQGVLVRHGGTLERLAQVRHVAFDKTGTLTELRVIAMQLHSGTQEEVHGLVAGLEAGTSHPVGLALQRFVAYTQPLPTLTHRRVVAGSGVYGRDARGHSVFIGAGSMDASGSGEITLQRNNIVLARFTLHEQLREDAPGVIGALKDAGISSRLLTGDTQSRAVAAAQALGISVAHDLSPADKAQALQVDRHRLAMVGDGLNDAPAMSSVVSFALKNATDLARGVADVTLQHDHLALIPWTLALSRRTVRLARRLLLWSTVYNLFFVALAAMGMLRPLLAGLSMLISSLVGILVALHAARLHPQVRRET